MSAAVDLLVAAMDAGESIPAVVGPTASGKTELMLEVRARRASDGPMTVISADAFQVFRGMDIGTAKPGPEVLARLPHRLISFLEPSATYSVGQYLQDAEAALDEVRAAGGVAVVAGGTGLYVWALHRGLHPSPPPDMVLRQAGLDRAALLARLQKLDKSAAAELAGAPLPRLVRALEIVEGTGLSLAAWRAQPRPGSRHRLRVFRLDLDRRTLYRRIDARVDEMLRRGLVEEVERLRACGITAAFFSQRAIGYREAHRFLDGEIDRATMVELIKRNTRHYAKRQMTWNRHRFPDATVLEIDA